MSGLIDHAHRFKARTFYGIFSVAPGYSQLFRNESVTNCLFGRSLQNNRTNCPHIKISGKDVSNRGSCDWLADYFGLPVDYQSTVSFSPSIKSFFIDFAFHCGLDEWLEGLWFRVWAPFVHTKWDLNAQERVINRGTADHPQGYFTDTNITRGNLLNTALDFFSDRGVPDLGKNFSFESLKTCRWNRCTGNAANGIADLRFAIGWNFFQSEWYHIGLGITGAAPAGKRPKAKYLFEPMIGNSGHWEVGAAFTSHLLFWRSESGESHMGGYLDANITHLLKAHQKRCFDLCGKPMSRYMLAQKMTTPVDQLWANPAQGKAEGSEKPSHQFNNGYTPVANLTCADANVSIGAQVDLVAMLNYTTGGLSFDLGYNLWARSCEKIEFDCDCLPRIATELWGLKGDGHTYGFGANDVSNSVQDTTVALSATQSNASLFKGRNKATRDANNEDKRNFGADNPQYAMLAVSGNTAPTLDTDQIVFEKGKAGGDTTQSKTSKDPVILARSDINLNSARTQGLSHSVFAHVRYAWKQHAEYVPFIGIGAQAEFAGNYGNCDKECGTTCGSGGSTSCCCSSCSRCSLSQWSVFVKGGVTFN